MCWEKSPKGCSFTWKAMSGLRRHDRCLVVCLGGSFWQLVNGRPKHPFELAHLRVQLAVLFVKSLLLLVLHPGWGRGSVLGRTTSWNLFEMGCENYWSPRNTLPVRNFTSFQIMIGLTVSETGLSDQKKFSRRIRIFQSDSERFLFEYVNVSILLQ